MLETPTPPPGSTVRDSRAMTTGALNAPLLEAFDRLVALLDQPEHVAALAPLIKREIHYRLMVGEAGARLRQIATVDTQSHQVARAIASLNARFAEPLRVETLARESGMSLSTFHHHFKALTAMSPLQYQKQRRLTESRRLMMSEGMDASTAAFRVGYESPSQFSREYRRLFGAPPSKDMADLRRQPEQAAA
ncbi:HTH-type transcriptional activator RhaS [compost metagenome]